MLSLGMAAIAVQGSTLNLHRRIACSQSGGGEPCPPSQETGKYLNAYIFLLRPHIDHVFHL
jgi:hypothetical protein